MKRRIAAILNYLLKFVDVPNGDLLRLLEGRNKQIKMLEDEVRRLEDNRERNRVQWNEIILSERKRAEAKYK